MFSLLEPRILADIVTYEGNALPEDEGWESNPYCDPGRSITDGWFIQHVGSCDEGGGQQESFTRYLGGFIGQQNFFIEWKVQTDGDQSEIGGVAPLAGLTDHVIAILGVVLCFLVPAGAKDRPGEALLDWRTAETIPWGVLLLFGGGMSLATAITATGLSAWIGGELSGLASLPDLLLIALITALVIFLTEVTSNIATASALMPVLGALALSSGIDVSLLAAPLALAASCAFMLPMATGPNAVAFSTGRVSLPTMAAAGLRLNLLAIVAITALVYSLVPVVL